MYTAKIIFSVWDGDQFEKEIRFKTKNGLFRQLKKIHNKIGTSLDLRVEIERKTVNELKLFCLGENFNYSAEIFEQERDFDKCFHFAAVIKEENILVQNIKCNICNNFFNAYMAEFLQETFKCPYCEVIHVSGE